MTPIEQGSDITLDQCIAFLARHGCSKHAVARTLDISMPMFLEMCRHMNADWAPKGKTIGDIQARRKQKHKAERARLTPIYIASMRNA
jgi:hypothetical protein